MELPVLVRFRLVPSSCFKLPNLHISNLVTALSDESQKERFFLCCCPSALRRPVLKILNQRLTEVLDEVGGGFQA